MSQIYEEIKKRILVLDGAMGTMLQAYQFTEEDFRGERPICAVPEVQP